MPIPFRTPHTIVLKRGAVSRDADSNVASQDFASPSLEKNVKCLFQVRAGDVSQDSEGRQFSLDGILYTRDTDILVDDQIGVTLPGLTETFRVASREPKYDLAGALSHMEIPLEKKRA